MPLTIPVQFETPPIGVAAKEPRRDNDLSSVDGIG